MFHSIRTRLTAWYTLVLAAMLVSSGVITYLLVRKQLERSTDRALQMTAQQFAVALANETAELHGDLPSAANEILADFRNGERAIVLLDQRGHMIASHASFGGAGRMLVTRATIGQTPVVIEVRQSLTAQRETLAGVRDAMLITIPIALVIASLGGYLLSRRSLQPVAQMSAKARAIGASNLAERIEIVNERDELGQLAITLNELLARLDASFTAQQRFMADASHELRSPVAILQGELDVTLSREDRDAADYRESLAVMRRSVRRLTRIVQDLFLLARGDAGELPVAHNRVDLAEVLSQTVREFRTIAAEREVALTLECSQPVAIEGDHDLLQRMVGNLIDNAINHTRAGTAVTVRCFESPLRIEVEDHGPGIPPGLQERIFERFFRIDPARSRKDGGGAGLGLPIARWIAEAHGGTLRVERSDERGTLFVCTTTSQVVRDNVRGTS